MIKFNLTVKGTNYITKKKVARSWGDFRYYREFLLSGEKIEDVNGWIVQSIERNTDVIDKSGNTYTTENDIRELTDNNVKFSVGNYDEFFRVKNGDVIDHLTKKPIADEFNGNEIKKYDESGETTIEEEDDTGGRITMNSKAYFVEDIVNGVNVHRIISNIGANVDAANGLISSDGHDNYDNLLQYRSSNEWCGNIQVIWDIPSGSTTAKDAGKNRYYTHPYDKPCNTNTGGKKRLRKTKKKKAIYNSYSSSQLKSLAKKMNVTTSGTKKEVATRILKLRGFLPAQHKHGITKKQRKILKKICKYRL